MMLPLQYILNKYNIHPKGVIHVGAHWAEEHDEYVRCGIERFVYIEPCKEAFDILSKKVFGSGIDWDVLNKIGSNGAIIIGKGNIDLVLCACGAEEGEMPMYVSHQNQGQSNSLLKPELHLEQHKEVVFDDAELVKVIPLDKLPIDWSKGYSMLMMDVQGFEGEVLKGATKRLTHFDIIYTEVNRGQTYSGNMEIAEMDIFLSDYGFYRKETHWPSVNWTWGDAVYIRENKFQRDWVTSEDLDML
jgi:FkbM family methyltransferase